MIVDLLDPVRMAGRGADDVLRGRLTGGPRWIAHGERGFWGVFRHADAAAALAEPALISGLGVGFVGPHDAAFDPADPATTEPWRSINLSDGAAHRALRTVFASAFTPDAVDRRFPDLDGRWDHAVRALVADGGDAAAAFHALTCDAFADWLGVPLAWRARFAQLAMRIARFTDPDFRAEGVGGPAGSRAAEADVHAFLAALLADHDPGADTLVATVASIDGLSAVDRRFLVRFFVQTGFETSAAAAAWALVAFVEQEVDVDVPEGPLVDELLRYATPVVRLGRFAVRDVVIGGQAIPAGDRVVVFFRAANRDPIVFPDPDRVVPTRVVNPHLAFGAGPHRCLGAPLARRHLLGFVRAWRSQRPRLAIQRAEPLGSALLCAWKRVIVGSGSRRGAEGAQRAQSG